MSLFRSDARCIVPLKDLVPRAEGLGVGVVVAICLAVDV